MLIDTHAHLLDTRFDLDRENAIQRADGAGVKFLIEIGCERNQWHGAAEFASKHENIWCVLGIHPQNARDALDEDFKTLESKLSGNKIVGIGETGLDYHYKTTAPEIQEKAFIRHIQLAKKSGKPLVIHCRDAYPELMGILSVRYNGQKLAGVVHCFSGTPEDAVKLVSMGFMLGIDGPVTYPSAARLKNVVKDIPLEKLVIETDSPYLPPQNFRGKRNEPAYAAYVAEEISKIKNVSLETVSEVTTLNAKRLFSI
jgi:TatD DNase family protein